MGYNKRVVTLSDTLTALKANSLNELYSSVDSLSFDNFISMKVYQMFLDNKSLEEIEDEIKEDLNIEN